MTVEPPQRPTGLRKVPSSRTRRGDGPNEFASFAAQLAARSERLRADIGTPAPSLNIDPDEARSHSLSSLLVSRRGGAIGAGVLLLVTVSVAALTVWGLPFEPSTPLPSGHAEQAKADLPSQGKLEAKVSSWPSTPPAAQPSVSPPTSSRTVAQAPASPAAVSPPAASAPPPAPKELARTTSQSQPPPTQIPAAAQTSSVPLTPDEVRELQGKLKAVGFNPGAVDGILGRQTRNAIRDYAQARTLPNADATRDLLVRLKAESLAAAPSARAASTPPAAQQADKPTPDGAAALTSDEVRSLQDRLRAAGYNPGAIDGVMGRQTRSAVRDYAEAQGIPSEEATRTLLSR